MATAAMPDQLLTISECISPLQLRSLKFLCIDLTKLNTTVQSTQSALDLLEMLERITSNTRKRKFSFIAELLFIIGRVDLLNQIDWTAAEVLDVLRVEKFTVKLYRLLLYRISRDLNIAEVEKLKRVCGEFVPADLKESIKSAEDLFTELEKQGKLSKTNFKYVEALLNILKKKALCQEIKTFTSRRSYSSLLIWVELHAMQVVNSNEAGGDNNVSSFSQSSFHATTALKDLSVHDEGDNRITTDNRMQTRATADLLVLANLVVETRIQPAIKITQTSAETIAETNDVMDESLSTSSSQRNVTSPSSISSDLTECEIMSGKKKRKKLAAANREVVVNVCGYPMKQRPSGLCIIINNIDFADDPERTVQENNKRERSGAMKDEESIQKLFDELDFVVIPYRNLKGSEMTKILKDIADGDHSDYDCFVCFIMTHGSLGNVEGIDNSNVQLKGLLGFFKGSKCKSLRGKPKCFFIQACQGNEKELESDSDPTSDDDETGYGDDADKVMPDYDERYVLPSDTDFILGYSTVPGFVSKRHKDNGSIYITCLVEEISQQHGLHMLDILAEVTAKVSNKRFIDKEGKVRQVPTLMTTMTKPFFLHLTANDSSGNIHAL